MSELTPNNASQFIIYQTSKQNISHHINRIYEEGELAPEATVKNYLTVALVPKPQLSSLYTRVCSAPSFRQGLPESRTQGCEGLILLSNPQVILAVCFGIAIHDFWIPAIPAGMTRFPLVHKLHSLAGRSNSKELTGEWVYRVLVKIAYRFNMNTSVREPFGDSEQFRPLGLT